MPDPLSVGGVLMRALAELEGCIVRKHKLLFRTVTFRAVIVLQPYGLSAASAERPEPDPPDIEDCILEAIGLDTLRAREIAEKSGYRYGSHFRGVLSRMVKAGLLVRLSAGYHVRRPSG